MPRNGSSVYSLPAGNPVISGTIIATTWANTTLTDIATALTNSLSTDGSTASPSLAGKTMSGGTFNGPTVTGILTLTGGQILFPAVQVPSANVNTLDDYEEGTWTPTFTFATPGNLNVVYPIRAGTYTKIGNAAFIRYGANTSTFTHTTASGAFRVTGVPFLPATSTSFGMAFAEVTGLTVSGFNDIITRVVETGGAGIIEMVAVNVAAPMTNGTLGVANAPTGSTLSIAASATYIVA